MSEHWIRLLVKYKGKCAVCGKEIPQGEYALWSRTSKAIKHIKCDAATTTTVTAATSTTASAEEAKTASAAAAAAAKGEGLKCFICGRAAGCTECALEQDCDRPRVSQACICNECMAAKDVYADYQQAFLSRMAKVKMHSAGMST